MRTGINRRTFVRLMGAAAAMWPHPAGAQWKWWPFPSDKGSGPPVRRPDPTVKRPIIGFLSGRSAEDSRPIVAAFHAGLKEGGYVEGMNALFVPRFADGDFDRIPELTKELLAHPVSLLVATGGAQSVVRAKPLVPPLMPVLFAMSDDPIKLAVVSSLEHPASNITGVIYRLDELAAKGIAVIHELLPRAKVIGFLVSPEDPEPEPLTRSAQTAAAALGLKLFVARANTESAIEAAFTELIAQGVDALLVDVAPFLIDQRRTITALAARHALPTVYPFREFVDAGGLLSYGISITDANRQLGLYTTQVLRGAKPGELPVIQVGKLELIVNQRLARRFGLQVPRTMLLRADEVIE